MVRTTLRKFPNKKGIGENSKNVQQLETKIAKMLESAIHIGIGKGFGRFEDYLSPYYQKSPFDRFLKVALADDGKFVCIYFGQVIERLFNSISDRLGHFEI